jgi:hypothetical protein
VAASRRQGAAGELVGATGRTPGREEGAGAHQKGGSTVRRCKRRRVVVFNGGRIALVVIDGARVRRVRLIEKNGGPGRRSPMKANGGAIRAKSCEGRSPPVAGSGHELGGGVEVLGELVRPGKRREKWGKGGGGRGGDGGHFKLARRGGG